MAGNQEELESFRRQWLEEVSTRTNNTTLRPEPRSTSHSEPSQRHNVRHRASITAEEVGIGTDEYSREHIPSDPSNKYDRLADEVQGLKLASREHDVLQPISPNPPKSALEHLEKAMEMEARGQLGESLSSYRKAYRLDSKVDQAYREKYFPKGSATKPATPSTSSTAPPEKPTGEQIPELLPTAELIDTFAHLPIPQADPVIENIPPPPCPISHLPSEVLVEILKHVALLDPALFARLSLVCKRLAYHVAHEHHIWRRICQSHEFGFASMRYAFACDVQGRRIYTLAPPFSLFPLNSPTSKVPRPLLTWAHVFQTVPRIRFTGIYISTVNYSRPGAQANATHSTWNSPIHIVTYYRYLRFYPDGTLISLLSTAEPLEIVPHINNDNIDIVRGNTAPVHSRGHQRQLSDTNHVPVANPIPPAASAALKNSLRGRWHLTPPTPALNTPATDMASGSNNHVDNLPASTTNQPDVALDSRDLFIETEGTKNRYTFSMHLALRSTGSSASRASKNTKLIWKGFWSHNRLTDDWDDFGSLNKRPYVFRRVKGWGLD
ncbi:hypothetical protein FQN57_002667 [Myotisia sp. PD_48]|nr:hypothetical protein FQN57_002667 [Myotisia sp. PD_48]